MSEELQNEGIPVGRFRKFTNDIGGQEAKKDNQPYILDLVTLQRLFFQTIPLEISVNPEGNWATISTPGRNNPYYQFTGGEDSLEFQISWYGDTKEMEDVITKCKWLESLSRNDGYNHKPHHVQFVMGRLFRGSRWIVEAAPYKLSLFNREKGMMPQLAYQDLKLKRVSETNRTRDDILNIEN